MSETLIEKLRERAKAEREIQSNNLAVADALKPQLEAFERRDGSHNTFAVRLHLDHRDCAKRDGELADDWDKAADRIERLEEALTPSSDTKADYIGEFQFTVTTMELDESEEPYESQRVVTVPWTTIKEIMVAIRDRAA